jgi:hypothetical protein
MHARVVRFSGVTDEAIDSIVDRIEANDGPPDGVKSTAMQLFRDPDQGTAIFVGYFANEDDLASSGKVLDAMDASETPGTRESIDSCELVIEREA